MATDRGSEGTDPVSKVIKGATMFLIGLVFFVAVFSLFYTVQSGQEGVLLTFNKADTVARTDGLQGSLSGGPP
jgi:regulator of protease activity HflC (stomatin/prohibitin superfamily)